MKKEIVLDDGYSLEVYEIHSSEVMEDGYRFAGEIVKDGSLLDNFEGSGHFATVEDVVIYLVEYLLHVEKITITKENIHLYYEFMSDEDKKENFEILNSLLYRRALELDKILFNSKTEVRERKKYVSIKKLEALFSVCLTSFGIKDTLKPIQEYIKEIKASSEYKEYIIKNFTFLYDYEKMDDFKLMTKIDSMSSYRYIDNSEYELTQKYLNSSEYKQYIYDGIISKYDLSTCQVEKLSEELADCETDHKSLDNLIYFALDIVADNFKMTVVDYIEVNHLQEDSGIGCISDIEVVIKDGKFDGLLANFDLMDFSVQNITMFIDKYRRYVAKKA